MKRHWKFYGSDGNGGFIEGVTTGKYSSMKDALVEEIINEFITVLDAKLFSLTAN